MPIPSEVWAAFVAVIGTGGVAWGTHHLTQQSAEAASRRQDEREARRFREQRLWDARKEAYSEILAHCRAWEIARRQDDEGYNGDDANPHHYDASDGARATSARASQSYDAMIRAFDLHHILLSDSFADRVKVMKDELGSIDFFDPPSQASDVAYVATQSYASLLTIAQAELGA